MIKESCMIANGDRSIKTYHHFCLDAINELVEVSFSFFIIMVHKGVDDFAHTLSMDSTIALELCLRLFADIEANTTSIMRLINGTIATLGRRFDGGDIFTMIQLFDDC